MNATEVAAALQVGSHPPSVYQEALAEALHLLRAFAHETDALELERRFGLVYVEPAPRVRAA